MLACLVAGAGGCRGDEVVAANGSAAKDSAGDPSAKSSERKLTATDLTQVKLEQIDTDGKPGWDTVAIEFEVKPGWHIYWINPGDSGLTTRATITSPPSMQVGPVRYPAPETFSGAGSIAGYGYSNYTALFATLDGTVDGDVPRLEVDARWLVCRDSCLRGQQKLDLVLVEEPPAANERQRRALDRVPHNASALPGRVAWADGSDPPQLVLELDAATPREFFPYVTDPAPLVTTTIDRHRLTLTYAQATDGTWPSGGQGVVAVQTNARDVFYEVASPWPAR